MSDSRKGFLGLIALVFVFFLFFIGFAFFAITKIAKDDDQDFLTVTEKGQDLIAVVEIIGPIMDSKKVIEDLLKAEKKADYKAIILRIDSPGGAVGPSQEIYEEIVRIDQKKPVFASLGTVAASGGYYIASAARKIYANGGTLTGSIGVIMQTMDLSKLFEFAKVSPRTLKAGKYKDIGAPNRVMTPEEENLIKGVINNVHQQFIDDILKRRKERIVGDIQDHSQGQFFSGEMALKMGLVDEIGGLWHSGRKIFEELNLKGEFKLIFIKEKKKKFSLSDFVDYAEEAKSFIEGLRSGHQGPALYFN